MSSETRDSIEIAQMLALSYGVELSPEYQTIRERLIGELSVGRVAFEMIEHETEQSHANIAMIDSFLGGLPRTQSYIIKKNDIRLEGQALTSEDPFTARLLKENILWLNINAKSYLPGDGVVLVDNIQPYWIVGAKREETAKKGSLLLLPVPRDQESDPRDDTLLSPLILPVRLDEYLRAVENRTERSMAPITKDEIYKMYNQTELSLWVDGDTEGTFHASNVIYAGVVPYYRRDLPRTSIGGDPWSFRALAHRAHKRYITDGEIADFNVFDHLNRLAVQFQACEHLQDCLEVRKEAAADSIVDKLVSDM